MKKLICLMLALLMVFGMAAAAFAEEDPTGETKGEGTTAEDPTETDPTEEDPEMQDSDPTSFGIDLIYDSESGIVPMETLKFTVTADKDNPDETMIVVGTENTFAVTAAESVIPVSVPAFSHPGEYRYTITEDMGDTMGVTDYASGTEVHVVVFVVEDSEKNALVIDNEKDEDGKFLFIDEELGAVCFENIYETSEFTVEKEILGNMSNQRDTFTVNVTLTADYPIRSVIRVNGRNVMASVWKNGSYTVPLTLSGTGEPILFANIPVGVIVSVEEPAGDNRKGYNLNGYSLDDAELKTVCGFEIGEYPHSVVVVNEKNAELDTGVALDSAPYILLLAFCTAAMLLVWRRPAV